MTNDEIAHLNRNFTDLNNRLQAVEAKVNLLLADAELNEEQRRWLDRILLRIHNPALAASLDAEDNALKAIEYLTGVKLR